MKDLSMHVLDIAGNSIRAMASQIRIDLIEDTLNNQLIIRIIDNGKGIPEAMLATIRNPFTTSRTHRDVGLGIPLLDDNCRLSNGRLEIESTVGVGTTLEAVMTYDHIDRPPLGDMGSTITSMITSNPDINIIYTHYFNDLSFTVSTKELQEELEEVPLHQLEVVKWLREYIKENISDLRA